MNKAEKRACQYTGYCKNQSYSDFLKGYHQAEKDLELTWKDVRDIYDLAYNLRFPHKKQKEFFEEVLKRFIESRKK